MSVMMSMRFKADPARFEEVASANRQLMIEIAERGRTAGAVHHRFFANETGDAILVVDEWPDAQSFLTFFQAETKVPGLMAEAGITDPPQPEFWRELDTADKF